MFKLYAMEQGAFDAMAQAYQVGAVVFRTPRGKNTGAAKAGVARVSVFGVLGPEAGFFTDTVYGEIQAQVSAALADGSVSSIILDIDSPGGALQGLAPLMEFLRGAREQKPIFAEVEGMAASAAFGIAAQANRITLTDSMAAVGSIGTLVSRFESDRVISVASTDAPLKNASLATAEGVESVRTMLDDAHTEFVAGIVAGRAIADPGLTADRVNKEFGRGGMVGATTALKRGMIDSVVGAPVPKQATTEGAAAVVAPVEEKKEKRMNVEQLRAEHPVVHAAVMDAGRMEGRTEGRDTERDRVSALMTMAARSGDYEAAASYIAGGNSIKEDAVYAHFASAQLDSQVAKDSKGDSPDPLPAAPAGELTAAQVEAEVQAGADEIRRGLGSL